MSTMTKDQEKSWRLEFDNLVGLKFENHLLKKTSQLRRKPESKRQFFWGIWLPSKWDLLNLNPSEKVRLTIDYFQQDSVVENFFHFLLKNDLDLFLKAFRASEALRNPHHIKSLAFLKDSEDPTIQSTYLAAEKLHIHEFRLFRNVEITTRQLLHIDPRSVVFNACVWLECKTSLEIGVDVSQPAENDASCIVALGLFLELYLISTREKHSLESFDWKERSYLDSNHLKQCFPEVAVALDATLEWNKFKTTVWDTFCWDFTYVPVMDDSTDEVLIKPVDFNSLVRWNQDEHWFHQLHERFSRKAYSESKTTRQTTNRIKGIESLDLQLYAEELFISGDGKFSIETITDQFVKLKVQSYKWFDEYNDLSKSMSQDFGIQIDHVLGSEQKSKVNTVDWLNLGDSENDQLQSFSSQLPKRFNRFSPKLNLHGIPLVRFGKKILVIQPLMYRHNRIFTISEALLSDHLNQRNPIISAETDKMEEVFSNSLPQFKRSLSIYGKECWPSTFEGKGDVDVAWKCDKVVFLFQLKRSKFRFSLKEMFYERLQSAEKAVTQLKKAVETLAIEQEFFYKAFGLDFNDAVVIPIVVHTSIECSNAKIDGVPILNYHDLMERLESTGSRAVEFKKFLLAKARNPWPKIPAVSPEEEFRFLEQKTFKLSGL